MEKMQLYVECIYRTRQRKTRLLSEAGSELFTKREIMTQGFRIDSRASGLASAFISKMGFCNTTYCRTLCNHINGLIVLAGKHLVHEMPGAELYFAPARFP